MLYMNIHDQSNSVCILMISEIQEIDNYINDHVT